MKKILLLFSILSMSSCVVPYDAETRLLFEAQFVDSNENALSNIDVEIKVSNGTGIISGNEIISFGKTNANGTIKLVFPAPEFDNNYKIFIRSKNDENLGFVSFQMDNLDLDNFPDYKLSFPKIYRLTFEESALVSLQFNPISGNKKFVDLKVDGVFCPYYSNYSDDDETYYTNSFFAKKNQTIVVTYKIENVTTGIIDTNTQEISIGTEAIETTINY
jgi:hypothetical protein